MPRQSAAALLVAAPTEPAAAARLRAPAGLSEAQAAHWHRVVDNLPADFFGQDQMQQLVAFCQHAAFADDLARRLAELDPLADGWARLSAAQVSHSKAALAHARSLRLTLQARTGPDTASNRARQRGPATLELLRTRYEDDDHAQG